MGFPPSDVRSLAMILLSSVISAAVIAFLPVFPSRELTLPDDSSALLGP